MLSKLGGTRGRIVFVDLLEILGHELGVCEYS